VVVKTIDLLVALPIKQKNVVVINLKQKYNMIYAKSSHMTTISEQKSNLLEQFNKTRDRTLKLVETLEKDDFVVQTAPFMSPPKWHLGHVSWLFEIVMSKTIKNYKIYSQEFNEYLNSYYHQFGEPHDKDKRGMATRPTIDQVLEYFHMISHKVADILQNELLDDKTKQLYFMAIHHECQHQELLVYDLQHLLASRYRPITTNPLPTPSKQELKSVKIDGGLYSMGYSGNQYCYDIELPEHKVYLNDYKIDVFPITNGQYIEFMEDGGYNNFRYWLSDGWDKVQNDKWNAPMYWEKVDDVWMTNDFLGKREVNPNESVCHVSFYEADAYSKWAGKRLPTEAEWEKAACWDEKTQTKTIFPWGDKQPDINMANLLESHLWNCTEIGAYPNGKSHYGCQQMIGDVWEWTSSEFTGYPGFKSGFSEYNDKWFANQKVLRGGSFGTPSISVRGSYRNFFRLDERWLFSGFRCAEDI
jgi:ergothioneine biosynthesis protein EgtB